MKTNKDIPSNGCMKCNCDSVTPKAEHTPPPWTSTTIIQRGFLYSEILGPTKDGHRGIAKVYLGKPNTVIEPQNEANAAFIVHAVNAHDEMLAALVRATDHLVMAGTKCADREEALRQALQAIAKAEGK